MNDIIEETKFIEKQKVIKPIINTTELINKINRVMEIKEIRKESSLKSPAFIANQGKHIANLKTPTKKDVRNSWGNGGKIGAGLKILSDYFNPVLNCPTMVTMPNGKEELKTVMDQIIIKLASKALDGDIKAVELILDRNFGKEEQKLVLQMSHEQALLQLKKEEDIIEGEIVDNG
jgi:hypothetical protein